MLSTKPDRSAFSWTFPPICFALASIGRRRGCCALIRIPPNWVVWREMGRAGKDCRRLRSSSEESYPIRSQFDTMDTTWQQQALTHCIHARTHAHTHTKDRPNGEAHPDPVGHVRRAGGGAEQVNSEHYWSMHACRCPRRNARSKIVPPPPRSTPVHTPSVRQSTPSTAPRDRPNQHTQTPATNPRSIPSTDQPHTPRTHKQTNSVADVTQAVQALVADPPTTLSIPAVGNALFGGLDPAPGKPKELKVIRRSVFG